MSALLHRSLTLTAMVCERGAAIEQFRRVIFQGGSMHAFNGVVHLQAPSDLPEDQLFAVSFDRLAQALRALADGEFTVKVADDFLIFKRGKLTVRIRKLECEAYDQPIAALPKKQKLPAPGLQDALRTIAPFVSSDASRAWSTAALLEDGYAWATNNLALVRIPLEFKPLALAIPAPAIGILTELKSIDWYYSDGNRIWIGSGEATLVFPHASAPWPDVASFFSGRPKRIAKADPELRAAAQVVSKFTDRFVTLNDSSVEGKLATIESEYALDVRGGKGSYNAQLFALVASHATHIDFGSFPKPVHFDAGKMQGLMVGVIAP